MTVDEFITILKKCVDPDLANITFYIGDNSYQLKSVAQFGIITDVNIELEEVEIPMMSIVPVTSFRRDKQKMIGETLNKIQAEIKITSTGATGNNMFSYDKPKRKKKIRGKAKRRARIKKKTKKIKNGRK